VRFVNEDTVVSRGVKKNQERRKLRAAAAKPARAESHAPASMASSSTSVELPMPDEIVYEGTAACRPLMPISISPMPP
jgi:hypothetical protein